MWFSESSYEDIHEAYFSSASGDASRHVSLLRSDTIQSDISGHTFQAFSGNNDVFDGLPRGQFDIPDGIPHSDFGSMYLPSHAISLESLASTVPPPPPPSVLKKMTSRISHQSFNE